jgi:UDP-N-acetylmuramate--alanine ligase
VTDNIKNIHFIGIGGAGMAPLALHSKSLGFNVTGSDLISENFSQLNEAGIFPTAGHGTVPDETDLVVYSAAVREDNPEFKDALSKNIRTVKRAVFLGEITKNAHCVLVSGSHGKSTTTIMLGDMLNGLEPYESSVIAGGESASKNSNYYKGSSSHIVIEADEYDRSFLKLFPNDLIILNIDDDHMDIYGSIENLKAGFFELTSKLSENSILIFNLDDKYVSDVVKDSKARKAGFGIKDETGYNAKNIVFREFRTEFDLYKGSDLITRIKYSYSGFHNVYNMLASLSLLCEYGIKPEILSALSQKFGGVKRRNEIIFKNSDYILIDDYAHHPTEVINSLKNIRANHSGRIIALFQPHLFSRTKYHAIEFAKSFADADLIFISHIYPAREKADQGINSGIIYELMDQASKNKTFIAESFEPIYEKVKGIMKTGDLIVSIGAGEINKVLYRIKDGLVNGNA